MRDAGCGMRDAGCGMRDLWGLLRNFLVKTQNFEVRNELVKINPDRAAWALINVARWIPPSEGGLEDDPATKMYEP